MYNYTTRRGGGLSLYTRAVPVLAVPVLAVIEASPIYHTCSDMHEVSGGSRRSLLRPVGEDGPLDASHTREEDSLSICKVSYG